MTSVPQLPIETTSVKAPPTGETPRGRANKAKEEGGEGGFATALAHALPERQQTAKPAKAERTVDHEVAGVEKEEALAKDRNPTAAAETATTTTPQAPADEAKSTEVAQVAEVAPAVKAVPVEALPGEALSELAVELADATLTLAEPTESAPTAKPTAAPVAEHVVEEPLAAVEVEIVEAEETQRQEPTQSLEKPAEAPEVETAKAEFETRPNEQSRPTGSTKDTQPESRPDTAVPATDAAATKQAPVQTEQPTDRPSTAQQLEERETPRSQSAVEPRRVVETPVKGEMQPQAADEPVIEFQVRKESPAKDVTPPPETAEWVRALESKGAETQAKTLPQSDAPAVQQRVLPQQAFVTATSAEVVNDVRPAEQVVPVAAVVAHEPEPMRAKETKQSPTRSAEHADPLRPLSQPVAAASEGNLQQYDEQAGGGDAEHAGESSAERKALPATESVSAKSIVAQPAVEQPIDTELAKQVAVKPLPAATHAVQPANSQQTVVPLSPGPLAPLSDQPIQEARPIAARNLPSESAIAAKLQQETGKTTLNVVLQDERLGRVALQLVERGGWIETVIRASDPRTAQALSNSAAALFETLQQRGLMPASSSGASSWDAQEGQRKDNPQREQESQRRRFRLRRSGGEFEGALARAEG